MEANKCMARSKRTISWRASFMAYAKENERRDHETISRVAHQTKLGLILAPLQTKTHTCEQAANLGSMLFFSASPILHVATQYNVSSSYTQIHKPTQNSKWRPTRVFTINQHTHFYQFVAYYR